MRFDRTKPQTRWGALMCCAALLSTGCDSSNSSPTEPPAQALVIDSFSTSSQPGPNGLRVQVRARVMEGLTRLREAVSAGRGQAEICAAGACVGGAIVGVFSERNCAGVARTPVTDVEVGFAALWLDADVVGLDFCVGPASGEAEFELSVSDVQGGSNVIRTVCAWGGGTAACFSD